MKQYDVPILLILFKRIDSTERILDEIRKVRPKEIFIVADGPRSTDEEKETNKLRKFVIKKIDWPCKIKKKFRKENWGCDKSSVDGLNWFFKNVEFGIFLEDDCLPNQSFFRYHKELLKKYKNDYRIKCICAPNFFKNYKIKESYTFSKQFFSGWGFSTWRRAWDLDIDKVKNNYKKNLKKMFPNLILRYYTKKQIDYILKNKIQGWDYLFLAKNALEGGLSIIPKTNLVENIGFDLETTHDFGEVHEKYLKVKRKEIQFPLIHPKEIIEDRKFNQAFGIWTLKRFLEKNWKKIFSKD